MDIVEWEVTELLKGVRRSGGGFVAGIRALGHLLVRQAGGDKHPQYAIDQVIKLKSPSEDLQLVIQEILDSVLLESDQFVDRQLKQVLRSLGFAVDVRREEFELVFLHDTNGAVKLATFPEKQEMVIVMGPLEQDRWIIYRQLLADNVNRTFSVQWRVLPLA